MRVFDLVEEAIVKARLGRKGEVKNELFNSTLDSLNRVYEKVYNLFPWDNIKIFNLSTTTSDGIIVFPQYVDTIRGARIANRPLFPLHEIRINNWAPELFTDAGTACGFTYLPNSPVETQLTAATTIRVFSSSASDDTASNLVVHVEGTVSGEDFEEELTLDGTTPVTSTASFTDIRNIVKPLTTGRITVDDGSAVLGTIAPWDTHGNYKRVQLAPIVDESTTVTFQCTRRFERLISDNDGIVIPETEGAILDLLIAELLEAEEQEDRALYYRTKGNEALQILNEKILEQQIRDMRALPLEGDFGDLGEDVRSFHIRDISVTGINS